jgi:hypothetical protein
MNIFQKSPLQNAYWPWSKMNLVEIAESAVSNKLYMPNMGYANIENLENWNVELGEAGNSKRLWLNSLISPHVCMRVGNEQDKLKFKQIAAIITNNYLNQYDSGQGIFQDAWRDEHAVANRLFVLTAFLHDTCSSTGLSLSQLDLLFHANRHACWLENDKNYVKNNHGVMMDLALAQFSLFVLDVDSQLAKSYMTKAILRLEMMLEQSFDSDGYCTENSPSYHFVNYALFSSIKQFIIQYQLHEKVSKWKSILDKAESVGRLLLRSDGTIPLIGDSEIRPGVFFPHNESKTKNGIGYFPGAGLFVANLPNIHLTFRAGGIKFSHRHVDDLSLTLWVRGKDFVVDCGLYNYDIQDKRRRWVMSSRAHSGFYLESEGNVLFANFESPSAMSRFNSMSDTHDEFTINATHNLSKETNVVRNLHFANNTLKIEDSFESKSVENWRYQLILHPNVELHALPDKNGFYLKNGREELIWRAINNIETLKVEASHYSQNFMNIQPCKMIIIRGQSQKINLITEIII